MVQCQHKRLEYSEEYESVKCLDCGKLWRDEERGPIINYPLMPYQPFPIYIPPTPQPMTPMWPQPQYPYTICCNVVQ